MLKRNSFFSYIDNFNIEGAKLFELNAETGVLKLKTSLDREIIDELCIRVKVSNNELGIISNPNSVNYTLTVNITVNDVNDNEPRFLQNLYAAGITAKDSIRKEILVFKVRFETVFSLSTFNDKIIF